MSTRKEQTRKRILDAAWRMLEEHGADAVRLQDVAAAADVSRQAVYNHFGSRGGLLVALAGHVDEALDLPAKLAPVMALEDPGEAMVAGARVTAQYAPQIQSIAMALVRVRETDEAAATALEDRMNHRRQNLGAGIRALSAAGRLRPPWSVEQATDLMLWAGSPETYDAFVTRRDWSTEDYETWLVSFAQTLFD